jgi:putative tryptophan/tyrosine transport system substrate-binding protein
MTSVTKETRRRAILAAFTIVFTAVFLMAILLSPKPDKGTIQIGVFLYSQQPVIAEISGGFQSHINAVAAKSGRRIHYTVRSADGDTAQATAIASAFRAQSPDVLFVVGLPAAQALRSSGITTPVVFGGPPDPVGAGLVPRLVAHGGNITGTKYMPPVTEMFRLFFQAFPDAKSVAIIHNPGESNSMALVKEARLALDSRGASFIDLAATTAVELDAAIRALDPSRVSGLFLPTDNFIYASLDRIIAAAAANAIPVFSCTKLAVQKGALFAAATDYTRVGELSAGIAEQILFEGKSVTSIDVLDVKEGNLYVTANPLLSSKIGQIPNYPTVVVR